MQVISTHNFWSALAIALILSQPMAAAGKTGKPDVYEWTLWKFKAGVSPEQGRAASEDLNASYRKLAGFEKRYVYFDKEKAIWINQIKWKHAEAAEKGRESLDKDPAVLKFDELLDKPSILRFKGERLFELGS